MNDIPAMMANDAASKPGHLNTGFKEIVDHLLQKRLRDLAMPPEILAVFKSRTSPIRRTMMASWCFWIASFNVVLAGFDLFNVARPALWLVLTFRAIISASFLGSHLALRHDRLRGREHIIIIIPSLLTIILAGVAGRITADSATASAYLVNALLVIFSGIMFVNIDLKYSKFLTVASALLLAAFILAAPAPALAGRLQELTLYAGTMLAMLQARKILTLYQHRVFLLNLREEITAAEASNRNAQLSSIAYIDRLTDIPNRRYFDDICASMSETTKHLMPLSLCMIDIDDFKQLNDTLGHLRGDHCLRMVANAIRQNLRGKTDILVRYGGEEFLLLLPETDIERAAEIAERVRGAIAMMQHENPGSAYGIVTASIGVAQASSHPVRIEALIEAADMALYRAKSAGRNRVRV